MVRVRICLHEGKTQGTLNAFVGAAIAYVRGTGIVREESW
jgi:hypothetical protein